MKEYLSIIKNKISAGFSSKFVHILREENNKENYLAKAASIEYTDVTNQVLSFVQYSPTIDKIEI